MSSKKKWGLIFDLPVCKSKKTYKSNLSAILLLSFVSLLVTLRTYFKEGFKISYLDSRTFETYPACVALQLWQ